MINLPLQSFLWILLWVVLTVLVVGRLLRMYINDLRPVFRKRAYTSAILLAASIWIVRWAISLVKPGDYLHEHNLFNPEFFGGSLLPFLRFHHPFDFAIKSFLIAATACIFFLLVRTEKGKNLRERASLIKTVARICGLLVSILSIPLILLLLENVLIEISRSTPFSLMPLHNEGNAIPAFMTAIYFGIDCFILSAFFFILLLTLSGIRWMPFGKTLLRKSLLFFLFVSFWMFFLRTLVQSMNAMTFINSLLIVPVLYYLDRYTATRFKPENVFNFSIALLAGYLVLVLFGYPFFETGARRNREAVVEAALNDLISKSEEMEMFAIDTLEYIRNQAVVPASGSDYFSWIYNLWKNSYLQIYTPLFSLEYYNKNGVYTDGFSIDPVLKKLVNPRVFESEQVYAEPFSMQQIRTGNKPEKYFIGIISVRNIENTDEGYVVLSLPNMFPYGLNEEISPFHLLFKPVSVSEKILSSAEITTYRNNLILDSDSPVPIPPTEDLSQENVLELSGFLGVTNPELRRDVYFKKLPVTSGEDPDMVSLAFPYPGTMQIIQIIVQLFYARFPVILAFILMFFISLFLHRKTTSAPAEGTFIGRFSRLLGVNTFRNKLVLGFLLVAAIPVFILYPHLENMVKEGFVREQMQRSEDSVKTIYNRLMNKTIEIFSVFNQVHLTGNPERDASRLRRVSSILPGNPLAGLTIRDETGQIIFQYTDKVFPSSVALERQIYQVFDTGIPFSVYEISENRETVYLTVLIPWLSMTAPYTNRGTIMGTLEINTDFIQQVGKTLNRDINIYCDRSISASTRMDLFRVHKIDPALPGAAYFFGGMHPSQLVTLRESIRDLSYFNSYYPLRNHSGEIVGYLSSPQLIEANRIRNFLAQINQTTLLASFAIFLMALFIALGLSARMAAPVKELGEATRQLSLGTLGHQIHLRAGQEFAQLIEAFNTMSSRLKTQHETVETGKQFLEVILQNVTTGVITVDTDGRITSINPAACALLDLEKESILGQALTGISGKIDPGIMELFRSIPDGRSTNTFRSPGTDGHNPRILQISTEPLIGYKNRRMGHVIVLDDVTDLIRSSQLETWQEAARRVAHEIKNPLTPIQLATEHLMAAHRDADKNFDHILTECGNTIIRHVQILRRVSKEFARHAALPSIKHHSLDINKIIKESFDLYRSILAPGITLIEEYGSVAPVSGDEEALTRVFTNIINNALQAMQDEGTISVSTSLQGAGNDSRHAGTPLPFDIPGYPVVVIRFADTGPGIPRETMDRLFEPHFSARTSGSGLGLAISRQVILNHNGDIGIRNRETGGAEVIIILPVPAPEITQQNETR